MLLNGKIAIILQNWFAIHRKKQYNYSNLEHLAPNGGKWYISVEKYGCKTAIHLPDCRRA